MKSVNELLNKCDELTDVKKEDFVTTKKLRDTHVEDDNQSVKWNRDFVIQNNELHAAQQKAYRDTQYQKRENFDNQLIEALADEEGLSIPEAERIFRYAWKESHSSGYSDVMITASEISDLVNDIKKLA